MRRLRGAWLVWTAVWVLLLVIAFVVSEGEPVCEGPLILSVDESDPPQCDDPVTGLPTVGFMLYAVGFTVSTVVGAVWTFFDAGRSDG